ncbi:phage GP46 family protein [Lonsdalea britannica]|uniref:phage GP46 family protein n=1 Tax=Lonsdalea britannica TaxID=1082704 RepID=UPI0026F04B2F|nr:phage GP46 family protein [Lonsdalea britannica]
MDNLLNPTTGDYAGTTTNTLENAIYIRIMTPLGSYWASPNVGSKLHLLSREKDVSRVYTLARQYTEEALQPLIDDGRAISITVTTEKWKSGWLFLLVEVVSALGQQNTFKYPVRVV